MWSVILKFTKSLLCTVQSIVKNYNFFKSGTRPDLNGKCFKLECKSTFNGQFDEPETIVFPESDYSNEYIRFTYESTEHQTQGQNSVTVC